VADGRLNADLVEALANELAGLKKQQAFARDRRVYIRMTPEETRNFDKRQKRIAEISSLLDHQPDLHEDAS
jgi:lysyl-tRNA synthetase class II